MTKFIYTQRLIAFVALTAIAVFNACQKDIPTYLEFTDYTFAGIDEDGGTWKTVLLASPEDITVATPEDAASTAYKAELDAVKSAMASISKEQEESVAYWTNNPTLRWNEIALELIAKYNLIPGPNEDDTYTLPNSANPAGPPPFPFAHPPYACRALAYLSVAQFDGMITAWHYKFKFNRAAPGRQGAGITSAYKDNSIPSYPSDGAVVAAASRDILSAMFPLEKEYLKQLAEEHIASLINSGSNVQSDIDAGAYIGTEIAKKALSRASTDGMKNAQAPKAIADSIKQAAFDRFGWKWENQEIPVRPVGLAPLFGKVKPWNVPDITAVRPPVPPALDSKELQDDIAILKDYAANVTDENRRIANFWSDGLSTYTPPGHWNRIAKEMIVKYSMNPLRTARTLAYMNMSIMDGGISCWDTKYYYHFPRPIQVIPGFKTILGTPNFPAYTSGHSVFSASGAEVLAYIFPQEANQVRAWAKEAAQSRVVAGIHWTFDAAAGTEQGTRVAQYTIDRAKADGAE